MKKNLVLGSFLAFTAFANAQYWNPSGGDIYNNNSGFVGIGTSTPARKLHIVDGPNAEAIIESSGNPDSRLSLTNPGISFYFSNENGEGHIGSNPGGGNADIMHFTNYSYVGIGAGSPTEQFHTTAGVRFAGLTTGGSGLVSLGIDANGKLWRTSSANLLNACTTQNYVPKADASGTGNLTCSQIFDNGTNVCIGSTTPPANQKLYVTTTDRAILGEANGANVATGVKGTGTSNGSSSSLAIGVSGTGSGAENNYGGDFAAYANINAQYTFGVHARVLNTNLGTSCYGIYATVGGSSNSGGTGPKYAGFFDGDVVTAQGSTMYSDKRLKKDILTIRNSMAIISKLNPVTYNFDRENHPDMGLSAEKQYGFISQEIKEILPEFTKTIVHPATKDENGKELYPGSEILGLNYNGFIALLTKGMQEQQQTIEGQQQQINELKALVSSLAGNAPKAGTTTGTAIQLSDKNVIVLNQNVPNPFAESTVISYSIPSDFTKAQIIFTTLDGKVIKAVNITEKGAGTLNVFGNDLTNGTYTYTLVVDGKNIDTKKLIKE